MSEIEFGAGLWNFASYLDRYATDGYGEARSTLAQIDLAAQVGDIGWVDLNYPFTPGRLLGRREGQAHRAQHQGDRDHPGYLPAGALQGRLHQPRPGQARLSAGD
ncbi:MAG: hypothetical protein QM804_02530 [Propionicimonas sp.]